MKKEDFIIGKWYHCKDWVREVKAARFAGFVDNYFTYSAMINSEYIKKSSRSTYNDWNTYKEISIAEIQQYLPIKHPDLELVVPLYVRWTDNLGSSRSGLQCSDRNFIKNKIFKTSDEKPLAGAALESWVAHLKVYFYNYEEATEEEYLKQFSSAFKNLSKFPEQGYCTEINQDLINYLKSCYRSGVNNPSEAVQTISWRKKDQTWWKGSIAYAEAENYTKYTIVELSKFINPNNKQNEQQKTNIVQSIENENSRRIISGTIIFRRGGQQTAVGSRPTGNRTSCSIRKKETRSIKISKSVIQSGNS